MTNQRLWRFLPCLLLALIVMGLPALSGAQICQPNGDVDRNGSVTAADALLAFQQALGLVQLSACQQDSADVFPQPAAPDGSITASDALCIFQKALSLPSCLDTLPPTNQPPVVNAGADRSVDAGTVVTLSGVATDSDGTITRYAWTQTGGTRVSLAGAATATATATFTTPDVSVDVTLIFRLTVTDNSGAQASDEVRVTVRRANQPPVVNAGADRSVDAGTVVTLSSVATDSDGTITRYAWTQTGGTRVSLAGAATATATFTAPDVPTDETLTFRLTVTDNSGAQASDEVRVTVRRANQPPVVNAGADRSVDAGTVVTLSSVATDSDGTITRYAWTQTGGTRVSLAGAATATATFTAPDVSVDETLTFRLTVTDNSGAQASDEVRVTVRRANQPPVADAGLEQFVFANEVVLLSGSGSDTDGTIVRYRWMQTSGPTVVLSGADTPNASFTAPEVTLENLVEELEFQLTVTDDDGASDTAVVLVGVIYDPFTNENEPPTANAGFDQTVSENTLVTLSGSGNDTDGFIVGYLWIQLDGTPVELIGWDAPNPSFFAPEVDSDEELVFELTVFDDVLLTPATDTVTITVLNAVSNTPPVADAGRGQTVDTETEVTLSGSGSDADGMIVSYRWRQTSGTSVALSGANSRTASFTAPVVASDEDLVFQLTIIDDGGASDTDTVTVTVEAEPPAPPVPQHALRISVFGEGDVYVEGAGGNPLDCSTVTLCSGMFNEGDEIVLIAEPDSGWANDGWMGCDRQDAADECTVFIDGDRLVSVAFLSTDPLELHDAVVTLRGHQFQGLIDYDPDSGQLTFDAATDGASQWPIGAVLLIAEDLPGEVTLARRITGIQTTGSLIVFSTEQASLEEIFRSGSFSYQGDADEGDIDDGALQYPGPIVTQDDNKAKAKRIPIKIVLDGGARVGGWIEMPVERRLAVNFSGGLEVLAFASFKPSASIGVEITGSVMAEGGQDLANIGLGKIPVPIPLTPAWIPVHLRLKIRIEGDAEASATVGVGAEIYMTAAAGFHYKNGKVNPTFEADLEPMYRVSRGLDFDLSWNVELRARAELHFKPFVSFGPGPFIGVVPYYRITAGCGDDIAMTYKGWRLEVGGDLKPIGGPRLTVPAYDSNPLPQAPISLSRMPSEGTRCPDPDMPNFTESDLPYWMCRFSVPVSDEFWTHTFDGWDLDVYADGRPAAIWTQSLGPAGTTLYSQTQHVTPICASCGVYRLEDGIFRAFLDLSTTGNNNTPCSQYEEAANRLCERDNEELPIDFVCPPYTIRTECQFFFYHESSTGPNGCEARYSPDGSPVPAAEVFR